MQTVLTFIYMLRYYNVDSSHIYLYAEALQCGQYSHLFVYWGITMWTVSSHIYLHAEALQCGEFLHLPVC